MEPDQGQDKTLVGLKSVSKRIEEERYVIGNRMLEIHRRYDTILFPSDVPRYPMWMILSDEFKNPIDDQIYLMTRQLINGLKPKRMRW